MRQPARRRAPSAATAAVLVMAGLGLATAFQPLLVPPPSHSRLARTPTALPSLGSGISSSSSSSNRRPLPSLLLRPPFVQPQSQSLTVAHGSTSSNTGTGVDDRRRGNMGKQQQQQQRAQRMARLFLGAAALVLVTGGAARAFPGLAQGAGQGLVATIAPIARMQDSLSQGPLGGKSPLAPVGLLLSWALDLLEVVLEGVGGVLGVLLWPVTALLKAVVLPLLGALGGLASDPQGALGQLGGVVAGGLAWVGEALGAYARGLAALVASTAGVVLRFLGNLLGALFNNPGLQYLDAMDPARHLPPAGPGAGGFRTAAGLKLSSSSFGLKEMYGRRWTVHAGKWDWAIPFWERCVMESQLARYRANWPKAAVKARFGFPEILRGPSPLLGGTFLMLTGIYLLYKGHVTSSIWIRQLQSETYGKQTWNPVTRLEEEEEEGEGGEGGSGGSGGEGGDGKSKE